MSQVALAAGTRSTRGRRITAAVGAATVSAGLIGAHVYVSSRGDTYSGTLLFLDNIFQVCLAAALIACCIAVGNLVLTRFRVVPDSPLELLAFGAVIGSGLIATAILLLGLVGILQAPTLVALLLLFSLAARKQLSSLPGLLARSVAFVRSSRGGSGPLAFGALFLAAVSIFLIVHALTPSVDWDSLMYHLPVPGKFLEQGRIYLPDDNLHAAYVGLVHMLYLPLLAFGSTSGPALVSALMGLVLGAAVFSFCVRFLDGVTASLCLALLWGTTTILLVAITPRLDVTLGLYLFLALYALIVALTTSSAAHFYLAAVLLGFGFGIKYHAVPYALGLSPLIVWTAVSQARTLAGSVRLLSLFGLAAFATGVPWLVKNWVLLGAPLYPFFAQNALDPWLVPFFGVRTVPSSVDQDVFSALSQVRLPFNLRDAFFAPGRLTVEPEGVFYRTNPLLLLLPLSVFYLRNRIVTWLVLPAIGYLVILILPFPETNLRYLIPAVIPLTIASVYGMTKTAERLLSSGAAKLLLVLVAVVALVPSARVLHAWLFETNAVAHFLGMDSRREYLNANVSLRVYAPLVEFVNEELPKDSRVLMLFEARGYYFEPSVIQDNSLSNWPLLAQRLAPDDCLERAGITHVLLGSGALGYYADRGLDHEIIRWEQFQQFSGRCLELVQQQRGYLLFRVR